MRVLQRSRMCSNGAGCLGNSTSVYRMGRIDRGMTTQEKVPTTVSTTRTASAVTAVPDGAAFLPQTRKFTVAEYYRMAEVGILKSDERVELIEGEILVMPPIGPEYANNVDEYIDVFAQYAQDRFRIRIQNPVRLSDESEPEPDVALLRRRPEGYGAAHPTPADVLLVIEVAHSSLEYDRNIKAHIYGRSGVPETWVRNLPEDCIERFTEPGADGYTQHTIHRRGETLTPVSMPDLELTVADLLPARPPSGS